MDAPGVDQRRLIKALRFIRRVNAWLGYTRLTVSHLERLTNDIPKDRPLRVLDVATGSADVPQAIKKWANRKRRAVCVVGLDLHETTLNYARTQTTETPLVRGDALRLPFADRAFDVVMTSMFLHHLPDELAIAVIREMDRVASRGIVVADILRTRAAHRWITLFTLTADPMVKHDARVSVRQAFTLEEAAALATRGATYARVRKHFGHRFVLAGRKD